MTGAARPDAREVEEAKRWFREDPERADAIEHGDLTDNLLRHAAVLVRAALAAGPDEPDIQRQAREYTSNVFESGSYGSMGSEVEAAWAAGFRTALTGARPAAAPQGSDELRRRDLDTPHPTIPDLTVPNVNAARNVLAAACADLHGWLPLSVRYDAAQAALDVIADRMDLNGEQTSGGHDA